MLGRLRIIPIWAAWAFALTSPLNIVDIFIHMLIAMLIAQNAVKYVICAFWLIGAIPAAVAMLKGSGQLATVPAGPEASAM